MYFFRSVRTAIEKERQKQTDAESKLESLKEPIFYITQERPIKRNKRILFLICNT